MIASLRLAGFKNFNDAFLRVGPFTIIVGTNASGKSNIRDAFRFLHGVGRGYTVADIIGGRYGAGGHAEWTQLRGAANEIVKSGENVFAIGVELRFGPMVQANFPRDRASFIIIVERNATSRGGFLVSAESLFVNDEMIYEAGASDLPDIQDILESRIHLPVQMAPNNKLVRSGIKIVALGDQPALSQIGKRRDISPEHKAYAQEVLDILASMRFLDLSPEEMRRPALPGQTVLGDRGERLPSVLEDICEDSGRKKTLISWLNELTPMDVVDLEFPRDPISGLVQLVMKERSGVAVSAYSASDGTLRFLAILAALLGKNPAKLYFLEEIDNGIHPSRLKLLLDLIEHQSTERGIQVVTTTHSPDLLSMIQDTTFQNTSVVFRPPHSDHAIIRRVADIPNAVRLREAGDLGELHASGWFENMLAASGDVEPTGSK